MNPPLTRPPRRRCEPGYRRSFAALPSRAMQSLFCRYRRFLLRRSGGDSRGESRHRQVASNASTGASEGRAGGLLGGGKGPMFRFSSYGSARDEQQGAQVDQCTHFAATPANLDGAMTGTAMRGIAGQLKACSGCAAEFAQWRIAQSLITAPSGRQKLRPIWIFAFASPCRRNPPTLRRRRSPAGGFAGKILRALVWRYRALPAQWRC